MSIKPTGDQLNQLTQALLNAFNHDELTRLTRHELDESLEWITPVVGRRDLTSVTHDLVMYFASQSGGLKKLLAAATQGNPTHTALISLDKQWQGIEFYPIPLPDEHPNKTQTTIFDQTSQTIHGNQTNMAGSVSTNGGLLNFGSINTGGGEIIGRDKVVQGDEIHGDKVMGDNASGDMISATIGDNSSNIAVGKDLNRTVTTDSSIDPTHLNKLFASMLTVAASAPEKHFEAIQIVIDLKNESLKGINADDKKLAKLLDSFIELVPSGASSVISAFASPILGGIAGPATEYVLDKIQGM